VTKYIKEKERIKKNEYVIKVMLAKTYKDEDPSGHWMSEKLDGVRAVWNGTELRSRADKVFYAPERFIKDLPKDTILDGELWIGRGEFQNTVGVVRRHEDPWTDVIFMIFDIIDEGTFEERQTELDSLALPKHCKIVEQTLCRDLEHFNEFKQKILDGGGEGTMLRAPDSPYVGKRSSHLLKVKEFISDEALVMEYQPGKGKHEGRLGALICEFEGKQFKVGTGFSDEERENPPAIGSKVTFTYFEKTKAGIPRHPAYHSERNYE
jgi:DNA ligase 1